jgi:threonine/homoserine/homoserine lactone efflux protein
MSTATVLSAGMLLGLSIAAPVGPMGLLCINRTLTRGLPGGLAIGAGIATGDAAYGAVAAFGFSAVTSLLVAYALPLRLAGGAFLIWLGIQALRTVGQPRRARDAASPNGLARAYAAAVGLTLTNPSTILSFIAAFTALGLATREGGAWVTVAGVFAGSALWWLVLCSAVAVGRRALTAPLMRCIDGLSALFLIGFGAAAMLGLL